MSVGLRDPQALERVLRREVHKLGFSGCASIQGAGWEVARCGGLAQRALGVRNNPDTLFRCGSARHPFTAVCAMKLAGEGKLELTRPLGDYLPDFPFSGGVNAVHLLTHTSGLPDPFNTPAELANAEGLWAQTPLYALRHAADYLPLLYTASAWAAPGERFRYNPADLIVLEHLIEYLSGLSLEQLFDELVFTPAGMRTAGFLSSSALPAQAAWGYLRQGCDLETNLFAAPPWDVYASLADWSAFWRALLEGGLAGAEMTARMVGAEQAWHQRAGRYRGWGLWVNGSPQPSSAAATGDAPGAECITLRFLDEPLTLTVLSNCSGGAKKLYQSLYHTLTSPWKG